MHRAFGIIAALICSLALAGPALAVTSSSVSTAGMVTLDGTLRLLHVDDFDTGIGRDAYELSTAAGTVRLRFNGPAPEELSGARVRVRGTQLSGVLRVATGSDASSIVRVFSSAARRTLGASRAVTQAAPATKNVALLLINFSDDASQPYSPADATAAMFTSSSSVKDFFEEESGGAVTVNGQVLGWYTIAASRTTCDYHAYAAQARAAASAAGVDLSPYTNFVYAFPRTSSCGGWAGLGELPGTQSWNNGALSLRVLAHELGHNFGAHHASSLSCTSGGVPVAISSTCTSSEYGDPFTIMGGGFTEHDHALHLGQFGWLPASKIRTVGPGGPYELGSVLDGPAGSARLLRIARSDGTWFYLDLRSVHGTDFDAFAPTEAAVTGVTVRISPDGPSPTWDVSQTQLIDTTPSTPTFADAPLAAGMTLVDLASGFEIAVVSVGSGVASVNVNDRVAPSAPTGLTAAAADATTADLSWTAATDNMAVASYRVRRDGVDVGAPTTTSFHDVGLAALTTYAYEVVALDAFGNAGPPASVSIATPEASSEPPPPPPPVADTVQPTAPLTIQSRNAGGARTRLIWTAATDDVRVIGYRVYRVGIGREIKTTTSRYAEVARVRGARYYVRAFDAAGNLGPRSPLIRP